MTTLDFRKFGLSKQEAALALTRVASLPLDPKLEDQLALAARAVQRGWWWSLGGVWDRWRFHCWRFHQRG